MDEDDKEGQTMAEIERLKLELLLAQNQNCNLNYKLTTKKDDYE